MPRPPLALSRRRVLGALGAVAAGCLQSPTRSSQSGTALSLQRATATGVSNEFSTPADDLDYAARNAVRTATETGEATVRGYCAPDPPTAYVVATPGPRYYRVRTTDHDPAETAGYVYDVEIGVEAPGRVRPFEGLPAADRAVIRGALGSTVLIRAPHYTSFRVVFAYERESTRSRSAFVPGAQRYVECEDATLRFDFVQRRSVRVTSTTVTADRVADSAARFREHVGGERGVTLDGLTDRQRETLDRAAQRRYVESRPHSEPFGALLDRLSTDAGYASLLRYGGTWYFVNVG